MAEYKYLIIGGGVAGTTAASTIRGLDKTGSVAIVSDEPHYLYSRLMLSKPNFFLGQIPFDQIWLRNQEWYQKNNITFIGGRLAIHLDAPNKTIKLDDNTLIKYDQLLLATGVCPRTLAVPGADKPNIFYLRTLDQGKKIIEAVQSIKEVVAVGGGFISFEMANLMRLAGAKVSLIIRENRIWEGIFDEQASAIVEDAMTGGGVNIIKQAEIAQIDGSAETITGVTLKDGRTIPCDAVIGGIGAYCNIDWLTESGIKIDRGVVGDEYLHTSLPDVWAAGDGAVFSDPILEEEVQMGNWVNAQEQGRVAGLNMAGKKTPFNYVSFYTTHGFDISITFIGNVRPKKEFSTVVRSGPAAYQHTQLIISNKELVGAVAINQSALIRPISLVIEKNIDVSGKMKELADPKFDLMTLLPN